ncbi:MAG: hypothetical protein ACJA04_000891 [Cellvibrionaceae bacterium]|jgi:hypothetical protein
MYGLLFSLCTSTLFLASNAKFAYRDEIFINPIFITLLFTSAMIVAAAWISGGVGKLNTQPLRLAFLGIILLRLISTPGVILSILVLGVLNYGIYQKQKIKDHGEIVLLELAPVDPRSLMQGDYMRLNALPRLPN